MTKTMSEFDTIPENVNEQLDEAVEATGKDDGDYIPQYRMVGTSRIPVSKVEGKLWQTRLNQAKTAMKDVENHWEKALKYFNIDQVGYKSVQDDQYTQASSSSKLKNENKCTENLIYTNIVGMLPNLYSQNPSVTITPEIYTDQNNQISIILQRIINIILQRRVAPGVNMQPKARKAILNSMITNRGVIKIGWIEKNDMNDQVLDDINTIAEKLKEAKDINEIKELEGQLTALNEMVDFSESSCCYAQHILPTDLYIDPTAQEQDGSDAKWMIERTLLPTEWLRAKFGFKKGDETRSVYSPKHVLKLNPNDTVEEEMQNVVNSDSFEDNFGYDNQESLKKATLTECFWVWDKVKRRVSLYNGDEWEYPIWVYDDPYHLEEFFPYYILNFNESPNTTLTHGEVSLYLDQQDEVNLINAQLHKMREFGFGHYLFNTNAGVSRKEIENWANGGKRIAGINLPMGVKFEDVLFAGSVPTDKNQILYEKGDLFRQIDSASGTDATIRSGEYKTNTTNLAIQTYMAGKSVKLDDKRDLIERWLGNLAWGLAQLVLQFMQQKQITEILGIDYAQNWRTYSAAEIKQTFSLQCVGGSTQRPNSAAKQQQAMAMVQLLGQFGSATPYALVVALRLLSRSFDSYVVTQEDIDEVLQSIQTQLQMQQQQAQAQANLANQQAQSEVVDQAAQVQQSQELPESVQNTILNGVLRPQNGAAQP